VGWPWCLATANTLAGQHFSGLTLYVGFNDTHNLSSAPNGWSNPSLPCHSTRRNPRHRGPGCCRCSVGVRHREVAIVPDACLARKVTPKPGGVKKPNTYEAGRDGDERLVAHVRLLLQRDGVGSQGEVASRSRRLGVWGLMGWAHWRTRIWSAASGGGGGTVTNYRQPRRRCLHERRRYSYSGLWSDCNERSCSDRPFILLYNTSIQCYHDLGWILHCSSPIECYSLEANIYNPQTHKTKRKQK
jgi:hypothetical protein